MNTLIIIQFLVLFGLIYANKIDNEQTSKDVTFMKKDNENNIINSRTLRHIDNYRPFLYNPYHFQPPGFGNRPRGSYMFPFAQYFFRRPGNNFGAHNGYHNFHNHDHEFPSESSHEYGNYHNHKYPYGQGFPHNHGFHQGHYGHNHYDSDSDSSEDNCSEENYSTKLFPTKRPFPTKGPFPNSSRKPFMTKPPPQPIRTTPPITTPPITTPPITMPPVTTTIATTTATSTEFPNIDIRLGV